MKKNRIFVAYSSLLLLSFVILGKGSGTIIIHPPIGVTI